MSRGHSKICQVEYLWRGIKFSASVYWRQQRIFTDTTEPPKFKLNAVSSLAPVPRSSVIQRLNYAWTPSDLFGFCFKKCRQIQANVLPALPCPEKQTSKAFPTSTLLKSMPWVLKCRPELGTDLIADFDSSAFLTWGYGSSAERYRTKHVCTSREWLGWRWDKGITWSSRSLQGDRQKTQGWGISCSFCCTLLSHHLEL